MRFRVEVKSKSHMCMHTMSRARIVYERPKMHRSVGRINYHHYVCYVYALCVFGGLAIGFSALASIAQRVCVCVESNSRTTICLLCVYMRLRFNSLKGVSNERARKRERDGRRISGTRFAHLSLSFSNIMLILRSHFLSLSV